MRTLSGRIATIIVFIAACSSEDQNRKPCPTKGIGVEASDGTSCSKAAADPASEAGKICREQVEKYKEYDCTEPQLCVDQGKRKIPDYVLNDPGKEASFTLTNCSTKNSKLIINKIIIAGDSRCSFSEPEIEQTEAKEIDPGKSISIRTVYKAKAVGEDHAAIHIYSNAQNWNPLIISLCGKTSLTVPLNPDAGKSAADGGSKDGGSKDAGKKIDGTSKKEAGTETKIFDCEDVGSKVNTSCPNRKE
jgi:hypothetical protein